MGRDRFDGTDTQVAGALKEAIGRIVGNRRLEAEGAAAKSADKAGRDVDAVEDKVRDAPRD